MRTTHDSADHLRTTVLTNEVGLEPLQELTPERHARRVRGVLAIIPEITELWNVPSVVYFMRAAALRARAAEVVE
jgi:hypothetical protein